MDCIFCKIIRDEIPSYRVYEDETVFCFLDISPNSNGHTLIIPKIHTLDITTIEMKTYAHIIEVARKLAFILKEKLNMDGFRLVQNNGISQEVKHFHLHLIPQYKEEVPLFQVEDVYEMIMNEKEK